MKNLKDVLEKLKVDDIVLAEEFPIDGTLDDMAEWLSSNGFEPIEVRLDLYTKYGNICNKLKKKVFSRLPNTDNILFANTTKNKISANNPMIIISIEDNDRFYMLLVSVDVNEHRFDTINREKCIKWIKKIVD